MKNPKSYLIAASVGSGAVSGHFIALGHELQRRGHEVAILTDTPKSAARAADVRGPIYAWPSPRPGRLRDARFLMSVISRHKPDCAIANFGAVNLLALGHWFKRVPVRIVWYHTLSSQINMDSSLSAWRLRLLRLRKSFFYSLATHVFANSQAASQDVQVTYGVPDRKCSVQTLSLADPASQFPNLGSVRKAGKITCVGRFSPSKGHEIFVRALALLKPGLEWEAVLLGDGPNRLAVERLARELGIANRCRFLGNCSHDIVLQEMGTAAFNVVPSLAEAYGFVGIESLALGLPVVASNTGGLAEIVRDSIDGFLVPPRDADAFSQKFEILLTQPELRKNMGERGRERFLAKFERSRVIPQQADWIEGLKPANALKKHPKVAEPSTIP